MSVVFRSARLHLLTFARLPATIYENNEITCGNSYSTLRKSLPISTTSCNVRLNDSLGLQLAAVEHRLVVGIGAALFLPRPLRSKNAFRNLIQ